MTHPIKRQVNQANFNDYNNLFGKNGPVEIPEDTLKIYASDTGPNYSDPTTLFNGWIDENNDENLRRCMVRDIVRQAHSNTHPFNHDNLTAYYITPSDVHTILIKGAGNIEQLRQLLRTRPKLLQELIEEFLYALREETLIHGNLESDHRTSYDIVIEIILSVTANETIGRQLWKHHTAKPKSLDCTTYEDYPHRLLPLVIQSAKMPPWLHDNIIEHLTQYLVTIKTCASDKDLTKLPLNLIDGSSRYLTNYLSDIVEQFHHLYSEDRLTDRDLCEFLRLFETNLPVSGAYLRQEFVVKTLPTLTDESIAQCTARRHVKAWYTESLESTKYPKTILDIFKTPHGRAFLYWLLGATYYYNPSDRSTIKTVKSLIATTKTLS